MRRYVMHGLLVAWMLSSIGCTIMAPSYSPDYSALDSLKRQKLQKIAVGPVEPKDPNAAVNNITLRGSSLISPSGTYARYIEDALKSDLFDANLLDPNSTIDLSAYLVDNDIDVSGFNTGHGKIEARFKLSKSGSLIFNKAIRTDTEFESSFAGAVAIPKGQNEYPNLVKSLLHKLYTDEEFIHALHQ